MKKPALAVLLIAGLAVAAPVTAAYAQASSSDTVSVEPARFNGERMMRMHQEGMMDGAGIVALVCSPQGAEELDVAFTRLSHRLELTDAQKPLFDALRTSALTAQTEFADTCAAALPAKSADAKPDLIDRLKARVAIDTARLEAINKVLPDLEAFYDSLTDKQKASLVPDHNGPRMIFREFRDNAPGRMERGPAPGR